MQHSLPDPIAYLGPAGTFTEQALRTIPGSAGATLVPVVTVMEALRQVRDQQVQAALVPIENSIEGGVGATLDELAAVDSLVIRREVLLPVQFGLFARDGVSLADISTVGTHPHAYAQCREWLHANLPSVSVVRTASTADAAVASAKGEYDAAICASIAGEENQLELLADEIADNAGAITRFVLVTRPSRPSQPTGRDITSLVIVAPHEGVGSLMEILAQFADRGVNLLRIESRPTKEFLGRYHFFLDCEGHVSDLRLGEALLGLHRIGATVRYLGSYRRDARRDDEPVTETEAAFITAQQWLNAIRETGKPAGSSAHDVSEEATATAAVTRRH